MATNGITLNLIVLCITVCAVSADLYAYGPDNGDSIVTTVNDGYKEINFTQGLPYYGYLFTKTYINENGLLSMITPVNDADWKKVLPISGDADNNGDGVIDKKGADARVLIAPFWTNVDITESTDSHIYYRQISALNDTTLTSATEEVRNCFLPEFDFTANHALVVTWDDVSYFGHTGTNEPLNKFQLVLVSDGRESFAFFIYDTIDWNAGTNDNADPEFGKSNRGATIGFNVGDPYKPLSHGRSAQDYDSQAQLVSSKNCDSLGAGHWVYRIDQTDIVEAGCKNDADLTVFPTAGSMFGGEEIFLVGPCWDSSDEIKCRFTYNGEMIQEISGKIIDNQKAVCIPQPFFLSGELNIEVSSDNGNSYLLTQTYYVANLERISYSGVTRVNTQSENWAQSGDALDVRWDAGVFASNANLSITALVYREDNGPVWEQVFVIDDNATNDGEMEFEGTPVTQVNQDNAFGAIRIQDEEGKAIWSDVHALGYLLNQEYQNDRLTWSRTQCTAWAKEDSKLDNFVDNLIPCPCTLQQAIVDTGRFQPDTGCSMYAGSVCTYHQGAKHCVRSVAATDDTHSGTQCCYNPHGDLMYSGDTDEGSTADRSHVWGAEPYQAMGMVPGLSHWKHDVITYYYCCLWGDECESYLELRPTADCSEYLSPKASAAFGDPHFVTFDGFNYTFNGMGEFTMVEESSSGFELQGRTEQAKCKNCDVNTTSDATVLTAVAMEEKDSDVIHVELNAITVLRFVRKSAGNSEVIDFRGQDWLDFNGVSIIVAESDNGNIHKATITFWDSGIGVNVTANGDMLAVAVTLPPSMEKNNKVKGLFGNWNGKTSDDLTRRTGSTLNPDTASHQQILEFGQSWEVETPLFNYEGRTHDDYQNNEFIPVFVAPDRDTLPDDLVSEMNRVCGTSTQCLYDVSLTRDITVGEYTIAALNMHKTNNEYTVPVAACPYLTTPTNGTKTYADEDQQNNLEGAVVVFTCIEGLDVSGPAERTCQSTGKWTGSGETQCIVPGEIKPPSPSSSNVAGIVIGVLVAVVVLVVICVVIFMYLKKKKGEDDPEAGEQPKKNKDYKDVKMSDVKDDGDKDSPPGEEDALNLEEATGAAKSTDD